MLVVRLDPTPLNNDFEYLIRISQWLDVSHLATDQERVALIPQQIEAGFAKLKTGPNATAPKPPIAMVFGDFEILADASGTPIELGRGGMGVTYRARQISMDGREVALKVIQPGLLADDNIRRRFLREAKLAGRLRHRNVAAVYSRGQEGDSYYYAMELVAGMDLEKYVKANGPLRVQAALNVSAQVASALDAAQEQNLIHRDIKPTNLMVQRERRGLFIKLIDFGLAKDISQRDIQNSISTPDAFKGSLAFASPEQCQAQELDTRSDLYSLGITLWFALTGKIPFRGNLVAVSAAHIYAPPPIQELPPLPEPVVELLKALLAKNPADRPQTPAELEDRIQLLLGALPADPQPDHRPESKADQRNQEVTLIPPETASTLIGAPVLISYLEPVVGQLREERFELLEALPEGVSGRLFRAREHRGNDSRTVALKFLHPSICAEEDAVESLKNQFAALHKLSHEHLLAYFALEIGTRPPFLVREWVHGLNLFALLRIKGGALELAETAVLLDPLAELLDTLASSGLSLVMVSLPKLWVRLPPELTEPRFGSWVKQSAPDGWKDRLALNPLGLRSLVAKSVRSESDVTLIPTSRSLVLQQNRAGIQGRTPEQLLASVIYELLSSRPPQADIYRPLSAIPELPNQSLKRALAEERHFPSAAAFWQTFKTEIPLTPSRPAAPPPQSSASVAHAPPHLPPRPSSPAFTLPPRPRLESQAKQSAVNQSPAPQPAHSGAKTRSFLGIWLVLAAFGFLCAVGFLGTALLHGLGLPGPKPQPTSSPAATPKPTNSLVAAPVPKSTPTATTTPSNDSLTSAAFDRGNQAYHAGDYQQAITDYTEAIRLKPDYAEAFNNRGNSYSELKQYDKAIGDYNEAIRLKPDYALAFGGRGNAYYYLRQYDKAIADYSEAIRLKPDDASAFQNRADCYEKLGNNNAAERDRAKAKELTSTPTTTPSASTPNPTPTRTATPTPSNDSLASAAFDRGLAAEENRDHQQAITAFNEAIRLKPDYAEAFKNRGGTYYNLKQYDKAIADFNEAIRLKPGYAEAFAGRGDVYGDLHQYDKALSDCNEAIRLKPDFAEAFNTRGNVYGDLKQYNKAIADCNQAIRLKPDFADSFDTRGHVYYVLHQYDKALGDCNEAIRLKPDFADAFNTRGNVYGDLKQYDKAIADFNEAIRLKPDFAEAFDNRGWTYMKLKQNDKALSDFNEAIRLKPDFAEAFDNRADCYEKLGNNKAAQRDRAKAKELNK
jgi:tetratricopeptide (TPR) repeat protein